MLNRFLSLQTNNCILASNLGFDEQCPSQLNNNEENINIFIKDCITILELLGYEYEEFDHLKDGSVRKILGTCYSSMGYSQCLIYDQKLEKYTIFLIGGSNGYDQEINDKKCEDFLQNRKHDVEYFSFYEIVKYVCITNYGHSSIPIITKSYLNSTKGINIMILLCLNKIDSEKLILKFKNFLEHYFGLEPNKNPLYEDTFENLYKLIKAYRNWETENKIK